MSSPWGKFWARDIVVPTGGWDFKADCLVAVATIPAGTYDDVAALLQELHDQCEADASGTGWIMDISDVGIVQIFCDDTGWQPTWASTDDDLSTLLGFDETETVGGYTLYSTYPHDYGWYPGGITYNNNEARGAGVTSGPFWVPVDTAVRSWSGSGKQRTVTMGSELWRRTLRFSLVNKDEVSHLTRGIAALWSVHKHRQFAWYPDRSVGSPAVPGTQGDPSTDTDDDCDYWLVDLVDQSKVQAEPGNPSLFTVELTLNGRPT